LSSFMAVRGRTFFLSLIRICIGEAERMLRGEPDLMLTGEPSRMCEWVAGLFRCTSQWRGAQNP
jgi:hypothetical protein